MKHTVEFENSNATSMPTKGLLVATEFIAGQAGETLDTIKARVDQMVAGNNACDDTQKLGTYQGGHHIAVYLKDTRGAMGLPVRIALVYEGDPR
jgi:hypothetical protein